MTELLISLGFQPALGSGALHTLQRGRAVEGAPERGAGPAQPGHRQL